MSRFLLFFSMQRFNLKCHLNVIRYSNLIRMLLLKQLLIFEKKD